MASNRAGVPSIASPLVDQTGRLTQPWYQFFVGLSLPLDFGTAAPVRGTWPTGWVRFNSAPAVGQPKGWVAAPGGTPGTWVSMGNL